MSFSICPTKDGISIELCLLRSIKNVQHVRSQRLHTESQCEVYPR